MRSLAIGVGLSLMALASEAWGEASELAGVRLETSRTEVGAPGRLGVTVTLVDDAARAIPPRRYPAEWNVRITSGRAAISAELQPSAVAPTLDGDVLLRRGGRHGLRAEVFREGVELARSEPVMVLAVGRLDFGDVRAGETVCRQLPGGGRGLRGRVLGGELPPGLRLWGACLVAEDSVGSSQGTARVEIAALSPSGRRTDSEVCDVSYRTVPRLVTPRRAFFGLGGLAILAMLAAVAFSVRGRRTGFGPGTLLAWSEVEASPYRGERPARWRVLDLDGAASTASDRRASLDVGQALALATLGSGLFRLRPTDDGQVELTCPRGEELRATTPDGERRVASRRLVVPYGSTVCFRNVAVAPLVGDAADRARSGGAADVLSAHLG